MNKKHSLISFVDVILTLLLIAFIVIFASLSFGNSARVNFSQKEPLTLTLRLKEIPRKHESLIKVNDSIYHDDQVDSFGKIKYVSYSSSSVEFLDKVTNTSAIYKSPDKLDVLILIECEATIKEDTYIINGMEVSVGEVLTLSTPEYAFSATVIKIEVNEGSV